jgi:hypothetical protein
MSLLRLFQGRVVCLYATLLASDVVSLAKMLLAPWGL